MANELTAPETMTFLERATRDPTIDIAKLEQLIELQERVQDREAKRLFAEALSALQARMPQIAKDSSNPHARSRYASFEAIDTILRPLYTEHGFSVRFPTRVTNGRITVGCLVAHVGGHSETLSELESGPDMTGARGTANKTEVQGIGSIVSYLKRYTLMAAFSVVVQDDETDDDGNGGRDTKRDAKRGNGQGDPRDNPPNDWPPGDKPPADQWDTWLDTLDAEAAKIEDAKQWSAFWTRPPVVRAGNGLKNGQLARFQQIQLTHARRVFPTNAEKQETANGQHQQDA